MYKILCQWYSDSICLSQIISMWLKLTLVKLLSTGICWTYLLDLPSGWELLPNLIMLSGGISKVSNILWLPHLSYILIDSTEEKHIEKKVQPWPHSYGSCHFTKHSQKIILYFPTSFEENLYTFFQKQLIAIKIKRDGHTKFCKFFPFW